MRILSNVLVKMTTHAPKLVLTCLLAGSWQTIAAQSGSEPTVVLSNDRSPFVIDSSNLPLPSQSRSEPFLNDDLVAYNADSNDVLSSDPLNPSASKDSTTNLPGYIASVSIDQSSEQAPSSLVGLGGPGKLMGRDRAPANQVSRANPVLGAPDQGGYFPTQLEAPIIGGGGADYPRSRGDARYWQYSGIWPERSAPDNFYQRNGAFYDRVERGLKTFIPNQNPLLSSEHPDFWSVDFNYGLPLLSQDVAPSRVMAKFGPLYVDILGVSATALYTSYSGDTPLVGVDSSGWIGILSVPIRVSLRLTDSLYLSATASAYYLPGDNKFGVSTGFGSGSGIGTNARLNYEWESSSWFFRAHDSFGFINTLADLYESWEVDEVDAVGRYRFGSEGQGSRRNGGTYWDPRFGGYRNDVGFEAQRPFSNKWWFLGNLTHADYWSRSSFEEHNHAESLSLQYSYMGDDYMLAPSFGYRANSGDYFDTISNEVYGRVTGRLTEYLTGHAMLGYFWQNGDRVSSDGALTWEVGLSHDLTTYTKHSISGGQVYSLSETLDEYLSEYARYTISHAFSDRLNVNFHAQYADSRKLKGDVRSNGWTLGSAARYVIGEDTGVTVGASYSTGGDPQSPDPDRESWLYYVSIQRPILSRLNGNITYQFADERGPLGSNYTEHTLIFGVNYSF